MPARKDAGAAGIAVTCAQSRVPLDAYSFGTTLVHTHTSTSNTEGRAHKRTTKPQTGVSNAPPYAENGQLNPDDFKTSYVLETERLLRKVGHHHRPRVRPVRSASQPPPKGGGATWGVRHVSKRLGGGHHRNLGFRLVTLGGINVQPAKSKRPSSTPPRFVALFAGHDSASPAEHSHHQHQKRRTGSGARAKDGTHGWLGCNEEQIKQMHALFLREYVDLWLNPNLRPLSKKEYARQRAVSSNSRPATSAEDGVALVDGERLEAAMGEELHGEEHKTQVEKMLEESGAAYGGWRQRLVAESTKGGIWDRGRPTLTHTHLRLFQSAAVVRLRWRIGDPICI